jgi:hypothetical protein
LVSIPKYGIKSAHLIQYGDLEENVLSFLKGIKPGKFLKRIKPMTSCWYMVHRQTVDSGTESNRRYHLHGKLRARLRVAVKKMLSEESSEWYVAPKYDEVYNKWSMAKDGKTYWHPKKHGDWSYFKRMMRK